MNGMPNTSFGSSARFHAGTPVASGFNASLPPSPQPIRRSNRAVEERQLLVINRRMGKGKIHERETSPPLHERPRSRHRS